MSNQFHALDKFSEHQTEAISSPGSLIQVRKQRVPPIMVSCSEFGGLRQEILNSIKGNKVFFEISNIGDFRVLPGTLKDRELLLKHLEEKMQKFFTYDDKTERLFKVVLKDLSSDYKSPEEIKNGINDLLEFSPVQVSVMKKRTQSGVHRKGLFKDYYLVQFNKKIYILLKFRKINWFLILIFILIISTILIQHFKYPMKRFSILSALL